MQRSEYGVERSVLEVQDVEPDETRRHGHHHHRKDGEAAENAERRKVLIEEEGEQEAQQHLDRNGAANKDCTANDGVQEAAIAQQARVIVEARPAGRQLLTEIPLR